MVHALPPIGVPWSSNTGPGAWPLPCAADHHSTVPEPTAAMGARPEVVHRMRREEAIAGAIGTSSDEAAPSSDGKHGRASR
jgi:hypothetical protein